MKGNRLAVVSFSVLVGLTLVTGCSRFGRERRASKETPQVGQQARYYHFEDVLIPHELKLKMDESFIYENPSLRVGRLVFSGRVQAQSLTNFFTNSMEKDGWRLVNKFGFKDVVLNFSKSNRNCTVNIYDKPFNTIVEVWVGPVGEGGQITPVEGEGGRNSSSGEIHLNFKGHKMRMMEYAMQYRRIAARYWRKETGEFKEVAASLGVSQFPPSPPGSVHGSLRKRLPFATFPSLKKIHSIGKSI